MRIRTSEKALNIFINVSLAIIAFMTIYPLWFVVIASVSSPSAISNGQVILLPEGLNIDAYVKLFQTKRIWTGYKNSILYTGSSILLDLAVQIPCAFALSRRTLPFRRFFNILFIIPMYFTGGIIPTYIWLSKLGMVDSPLALIVPACVSVFNLIIAKNYFASNIPDTLVEAARIDGCGYIRFFASIAVPLSGAIIAIIALYSMQAHWNGYLGPVMYLYTPEKHTLQQVVASITANLDSSLTEFTSLDEVAKITQEKQLLKYAVVFVSSLPLIVVYPFVQKFFVKGVMVGAIKG